MAFDVTWWMKRDGLVVECVGEKSKNFSPIAVVLKGSQLEVISGEQRKFYSVRQRQLDRSMFWENREVELFVNLRLAGNQNKLQGQLYERSSDEWSSLACLPQ